MKNLLNTSSLLVFPFFIFFLIVFFPVVNYGQAALPTYTFIDNKINHIYFSKDSTAFLNLYKKIQDLKNGDKKRLTIAHMGGSHVQGGTWSHVFLSDLQNQFNTSGGGYFVFPYKIAKTNGQPYVTSFSNGNWKRCRAVSKEFCVPLGMNAMNIHTNDSSNYFGVAITKNSICRQFTSLRIYHNFNKSFDFVFSEKNNVFAERTDDELKGYTSIKLAAPLDSVIFELSRKDTLHKDFIMYGFSLENENPGFYLAGLGANGASSSSFLRCDQLVPQLQSLDVDLMILSLGVNDTQAKSFAKEEYIEHYDSLITLIKKAQPGVAILLTTTSDNYVKRKTSNKRTVLAKDAMFELMNTHDVAVWDLFSLMGGFKSMSKWYKVGLASKDKVHFSPKGYTLLGHFMFDALNNSFNNYQNNRQ